MTISQVRRALVPILCVLALSACGFHLRGPQPLPFRTILLGMNPYDDFTANIKRHIATSGSTQVVENPDEADVRLLVVRNNKEKYIISLNSSGTVREYQLRQRFGFRLIGRKGNEVLSYNEIYVYRDVSFNDEQTLAKEQEENLLFRDMENDLVQQLMRRLAKAAP